MSVNNFNRVAFLYDALVRLVFGNAMVKAQTFLLSTIKANATILIIGGGTGWILKTLRPDCEVWYVDASSKMIGKAREQDVDCKVHFIHGTENDIPDRQFDIIITNFYFDLFTTTKVEVVINKIKTRMKSNAYWIATDFVDDVWWHRFMLGIMYLFFRLTCNIESKILPAWTESFNQNDFQVIESKTFYAGFIKTVLWKQ
ncbi:MAG TPA: class I SAM-dependent methyltransferase [Cyclobacteriaceae bacterium]